MKPCRQLFRFTVARKKLLLWLAVIYIVGLYSAYRVVMKHSGIRISSGNGSSLLPPIIERLSSLLVFGYDTNSNDSNTSSTDDEFFIVDTGKVVIAIGGGITSKGSHLKIDAVDEKAMQNLQFFSTLLVSFCRTAGSKSGQYHYRFYLGYDVDDPLFTNRLASNIFRRIFMSITAQFCGPRSIDVSLKLVKCRHSGRPAWAQNDAMLEAYLDGAEFFYRVNDDTHMLNGGWTDSFIRVLNGYNPPRVGVVGPRHSGGNTGILTYDFVHRTHIDVFGFYYPRVFGDWYGDSWITRVYQPGRSTKLETIHLKHTMALGRRYQLVSGIDAKVKPRLVHDKIVLDRYIAAVQAATNRSSTSFNNTSSNRFVALLLNSSEPRAVWGAVRNAQLMPVYLPDWRLRVYIPSDDNALNQISNTETYNSMVGDRSTFKQPQVSRRVIRMLERLGVDVKRFAVDDPVSRRFLMDVIFQDVDVEYVLLRRVDWRISEREAAAIVDWFRAGNVGGQDTAVVHCIHDDVRHAQRALVDDLWGFRVTALKQRLQSQTVNGTGKQPKNIDDETYLDNIWPLVAEVAYCHDSVPTCYSGPAAGKRVRFPIERRNGEDFIGQSYDENHEPVESIATNMQAENVCENASSTKTVFMTQLFSQPYDFISVQ